MDFDKFNPDDFNRLINSSVAEMAKQVMLKREELLRAYVAETGLYPSDCLMIECAVPHPTGLKYEVSVTWRAPEKGGTLLPRFTPREACCTPGEKAALDLVIPTVEEGAELIRAIAMAMQQLARHPGEPASVGLRGCLLR